MHFPKTDFMIIERVIVILDGRHPGREQAIIGQGHPRETGFKSFSQQPIEWCGDEVCNSAKK